ncbi:hypothetical protein LSAT2_029372 [Lamellibrachia satsuma]|nr:hypothetical protein LSAT2_029372 [Lamellibrachia satsuma]
MAPTNQIFAPALSPQSAVVCGGPASPCSVVASGLPCTGSVVVAVSGLHPSTPTPPPPPMSLTTCMELVWHGEFNNLFSQYVPDAWTLIPTSQAPSSRWRVYRDSAKVRFCCQVTIVPFARWRNHDRHCGEGYALTYTYRKQANQLPHIVLK